MKLAISRRRKRGAATQPKETRSAQRMFSPEPAPDLSPSKGGKILDDASAAKFLERYEQQNAEGRLPTRRKCLGCGRWFKPTRAKHFYCKRFNGDCKWARWERSHPRVQVTARGGARRWQRLRSEKSE